MCYRKRAVSVARETASVLAELGALSLFIFMVLVWASARVPLGGF